MVYLHVDLAIILNNIVEYKQVANLANRSSVILIELEHYMYIKIRLKLSFPQVSNCLLADYLPKNERKKFKGLLLTH